MPDMKMGELSSAEKTLRKERGGMSSWRAFLFYYLLFAYVYTVWLLEKALFHIHIENKISFIDKKNQIKSKTLEVNSDLSSTNFHDMLLLSYRINALET